MMDTSVCDSDALPGGTDEWHIAGVLVHADPVHIARVRQAIELMAGAEVHASNDVGKLVVTLEAPSSRAISAHLDHLQKLDKVLAATLVYQHCEDMAEMQEELSDEHSSGLH
jgi:nitrate reductase NapD